MLFVVVFFQELSASGSSGGFFSNSGKSSISEAPPSSSSPPPITPHNLPPSSPTQPEGLSSPQLDAAISDLCTSTQTHDPACTSLPEATHPPTSPHRTHTTSLSPKGDGHLSNVPKGAGRHSNVPTGAGHRSNVPLSIAKIIHSHYMTHAAQSGLRPSLSALWRPQGEGGRAP